MPQPPLPMFETLESRQMLSASPLAWLTTTSTPQSTTYAPMAKSAKKVKAAASDPLVAFYSGRYTTGGQYAGAFTLAIQQKISEGNYFGYIGYESPTASVRMNVQIRTRSGGRFSVSVVSAGQIIRITGTINSRSGQMTGTFQTWNTSGTSVAQITLNRSQTPPNPRGW